jgi:hypothetical protein
VRNGYLVTLKCQHPSAGRHYDNWLERYNDYDECYNGYPDGKHGCSNSDSEGLRQHWTDINLVQYIAALFSKTDVDYHATAPTTTGSATDTPDTANATDTTASNAYAIVHQPYAEQP